MITKFQCTVYASAIAAVTLTAGLARADDYLHVGRSAPPDFTAVNAYEVAMNSNPLGRAKTAQANAETGICVPMPVLTDSLADPFRPENYARSHGHP